VRCDKVWAFVYAKAKNVRGKAGRIRRRRRVDVDGARPRFRAHHFLRGRHRDGATAHAFTQDVVERLSTRVQLTTDGHNVYLEAVEDAFGNAIAFTMLVKTAPSAAP
jgi:hypothetical protein